MKKITLLAAALLMVTGAANASETTFATDAERNAIFSFDEPIAFTERGVTFFIFPNGEFDFSTEPSTGSDIYYRKGRQNHGVNTTYGAPGSFHDGGIRIEHDAQGRLRRIGNVFVNYDRTNRVKRIGSVYMNYQRSALTQVGGLRIIYDRRGRIVDMVGAVKGYAPGQNHHGYQQNYAYQNNYSNEDYYYYKEDGTKALLEEKEKVTK